MRRIVRSPLFLLCLPLVAFLVGCADQAAQAPTAPTGVLSSASTASAGGLSSMTAAAKLSKPDVPFRGAVTGALEFGVANPQNCPSGVTGVSNATGTALHMGNMTYHTEQCVNPSNGAVAGKVLVLTAANGDELHGTFDGQSKPGNVAGQYTVEAKFTFTGGTGRFENATGMAEMTGVLIQTATLSASGRWEWTGTIRY